MSLYMRKHTFILYIALTSFFLNGCANKVQKTQQPQPAQREAQTQKTQSALPKQEIAKAEQKPIKARKLEHWQAEGRIATKQGSKGHNASFVWTQRGETYRIKLYGPFGSGSAYISGHPQAVELKEANGKITRARSPEELLQKVAHLNMPISGLRYWLTGNACPNKPVSSQLLNAKGQLNYLVQQGWKIQYENYNGANLPSKLQLQNGDIKVKMIVTHWQPLMSGKI